MHNDGVFLNVPFDRRYRKLFDALVFAVRDCGFAPRGAREEDDSSQVRLEKIYGIIGECRFGIHDLSRVTLDSKYRLPRFNMPLELGIFLGAKRYGSARHSRKSCLVLDRDPYRVKIFCSDIGGQDIRAHANDVRHAVRAVREWLRTTSRRAGIRGPTDMANRYIQFRIELRPICRAARLDLADLSFVDYRTIVDEWVLAHQRGRMPSRRNLRVESPLPWPASTSRQSTIAVLRLLRATFLW